MEIDNDVPLKEKGLEYYNEMSPIALARWMGLLMAIDSIDEYCEQTDQPLDENTLKPIPIKHFIDSKFPQIMNELKRQQLLTPSQNKYITCAEWDMSFKNIKKYLFNDQTLKVVLPNNMHSSPYAKP